MRAAAVTVLVGLACHRSAPAPRLAPQMFNDVLPATARLSVTEIGRSLVVGDTVELAAQIVIDGQRTIGCAQAWSSTDARVASFIPNPRTAWSLVVHAPGTVKLIVTCAGLREELTRSFRLRGDQ